MSERCDREYAAAGRAYLAALFGAPQYARWTRLQEQMGFTSESAFCKFLLDELEANDLYTTITTAGAAADNTHSTQDIDVGICRDGDVVYNSDDGGLLPDDCCVVFEDTSGNFESSACAAGGSGSEEDEIAVDIQLEGDCDDLDDGREIGIDTAGQRIFPVPEPLGSTAENGLTFINFVDTLPSSPGYANRSDADTSLPINFEAQLPSLTKPPRKYPKIRPMIFKESSAGGGGGKVYACPLCPFRSRYQSAWYRHQSVHSGVKPYRCEVCDFSCRQQYYLAIHRRIHTGERPYKCPYCDYGASFKKSFENHVERKHGHLLLHSPATATATRHNNGNCLNDTMPPHLEKPPT